MSDCFDHFYDAMESMEQAYLWGEIEPGDSRGPEPKRCNYCHTYLLHWGKTEKGWRLHDSEGALHKCKNGKKIIFKKH
ncbi:hypothetical protein KAR91_13630 [Candidatus Pacearchaeota archaeon]|nr:hypothetical protein [Candidatus Pacearchaeota archaeon]